MLNKLIYYKIVMIAQSTDTCVLIDLDVTETGASYICTSDLPHTSDLQTLTTMTTILA